MKYDVVWVSELFEDVDHSTGEIIERYRYFLRIQYENGKRLNHNHYFQDEEIVNDFLDLVKTSLNNGERINSLHWEEVDPAYGSEYYQKSNK